MSKEISETELFYLILGFVGGTSFGWFLAVVLGG
jgi:hypothetical protein